MGEQGVGARMTARRVLLIGAQQASPPLPDEGNDSGYTRATRDEVASLLQQQPPCDAIVIDGAGDDPLALLRQIAATNYLAPIILLVPPGADDLARDALAAGAWGCVLRTADYREQLRWTIEA